MSHKITILAIEDEHSISNLISTILTSNGYKVILAHSGKEGLSLIQSHRPDIVLLDLGLPDMDGLDVLKSLRTWSSTPVIIVSVRGKEQEKVLALDLGADDYLTKPFGTGELLARIRTALRHSQQFVSQEGRGPGEAFVTEDLRIDFDRRQVYIKDKEVHLTQIEYKIVTLLARHVGRVLTYDFIINQIWGPNGTIRDNQLLRVNMANIRRKIEENPADPYYIITEVGVGYRMLDRK